jgi:hypothetical protein
MVANGDCPIKGSGKCHRKQTVLRNGGNAYLAG